MKCNIALIICNEKAAISHGGTASNEENESLACIIYKEMYHLYIGRKYYKLLEMIISASTY